MDESEGLEPLEGFLRWYGGGEVWHGDKNRPRLLSYNSTTSEAAPRCRRSRVYALDSVGVERCPNRGRSLFSSHDCLLRSVPPEEGNGDS